VNPFVIEADQQSDTHTSAKRDLGACLGALVTVVASRAASVFQKRQVGPFAFDGFAVDDETIEVCRHLRQM